MTRREYQSGMSNTNVNLLTLPAILQYPKMLNYQDCPEIEGQYCYVFPDYSDGISCVLKIDSAADGQWVGGIKFGDWRGVELMSSDSQAMSILNISGKLFEMMRTINIAQIQLDFAHNEKLVDGRIYIDQLIGPGMLRDLFSKVVPFHESVAIEIINKEKLENLHTKHGNLILKPSKFKNIDRGGETPLYVRYIK